MPNPIVQLLQHAEAPLSAEEEAGLHAEAQKGDRAARERLIFALLPWAYQRCKRRHGYGLNRQDYFQIALMGLIQAVDTFDPNRGRLITHASFRILRALQVAQHRGDLIRRPFFHTGDAAPVPPKQVGAMPEDWQPPAPLEPDEPELDRDCLLILNERPRQVVEQYFWQARTLKQIGEGLTPPVTRERVRQILRAALAKLRRHLKRGAG